MSKCVVKMIIDGVERTVKECDSYIVANQYKLFREENEWRDSVEYKIV